ncbi:phosphopantetheine-binding protein [Methylocystis sp. WRRC1]|uniref:phosphopantetheine-binding protein n=1 Tax=unclassified Methylocystis TaxID=2625913 RepID=UPI0001F86807|nr:MULTISPECIES: phosphopantetheine-binding protein [unclassified Methylocystis]MCC3247188.1 phosphopantetheine-binding protein [Methylocystis sp. WRRC1]
MLDVPSQTKTDRISAIVGGFIKDFGVIRRDQDLQSLGLTSMDMVNLMLSIEAEFDLTIPGSKLVPANFRTIESIELLVHDLGG